MNLILIPGVLSTELLWKEQIKALSSDATVSVTKAHFAHDDIRDIAADILESAPDRFAVAGISFGGHICFEIIRQSPTRIAKLALLNTSARGVTSHEKRQRTDIIKLINRGRYVGLTKKLAETYICNNAPRKRELVNEILEMSEEVKCDSFIRQQKALLSRPDSRRLLKRIECHALIVGGREDIQTPLELQMEIRSEIPNSNFLALENCGHLSPMEKPQEVNRALKKWLAK